MGTRIELHAFGPRASADALSAARRAIQAVDDALTIHRPSPATALNDALMAGDTATIADPLLFEALVLADEGHGATGGLFDIAADARRAGDWRYVRLDREARRVAADRPLALDFGGMGKGFALDRAAAALRAAGIASALLSAGESSIAVIGHHPLGGGWPFAIPHSVNANDILVEIELVDEALSISSTVGGGAAAPERSATIDPGRGTAVAAPRLTAALAPRGVKAEMMSTALLAADDAAARRLLAEAPRARFRFDLGTDADGPPPTAAHEVASFSEFRVA